MSVSQELWLVHQRVVTSTGSSEQVQQRPLLPFFPHSMVALLFNEQHRSKSFLGETIGVLIAIDGPQRNANVSVRFHKISPGISRTRSSSRYQWADVGRDAFHFVQAWSAPTYHTCSFTPLIPFRTHRQTVDGDNAVPSFRGISVRRAVPSSTSSLTAVCTFSSPQSPEWVQISLKRFFT
jgi:hypothetical protein